MGNSVGRRHAAHFDGYIPRFRAVVDLGQKVAVDVDHGIVFTSKKSMCNITIRTHIPRAASQVVCGLPFSACVVTGLGPASTGGLRLPPRQAMPRHHACPSNPKELPNGSLPVS